MIVFGNMLVLGLIVYVLLIGLAVDIYKWLKPLVGGIIEVLGGFFGL